MANATNEYLLKVDELKTHFPIVKGLLKKKVGVLKAVDGVSFQLDTKETVGLVGESGCGKTTVAKSVMRALKPTSGEILFQRDGQVVDLAKATEKDLRELWRDIQMVFQDPFSSLDPRMTVRDIIGEALRAHKVATGRAVDERVEYLMKAVGLNYQFKMRYPHAFSGGQRQRIGFARALALNPRLIVADEPTSALDVSVQAQILNLMKDLQDEFGLSYLFISHDLGVVNHICKRVLIMYVGNLVEVSPTEDLFVNPRHPYTETLLSSVPNPNPNKRNYGKRILPKGDIADPMNLPSGCAFHPRCPYARDLCRVETPKLTRSGQKADRWAACHRADEISLRGFTAG